MNWLDLTITVCLAAGLIKGLFDGFVRQLVSFVALLAAIFFAGQLSKVLSEWLVPFVPSLSSGVSLGLCYVLSFSLIIIAIVILGRVVDVAIKMTPAKMLNSLLGGVFGILIGLFSLSILFNLIVVFDPQSYLLSQEIQDNSILFKPVKSVVSVVYPFITEYFKK
ncbi:hypothetical protein FACS1894123_07230 [Bacteroidia bacterium]|nr:hypothetical protein FACS1894123_07230 [Bacteroidia bacterium]